MHVIPTTLIALAIASVASAADSDVSRVFADGHSNDPRLTESHDVDHPWSFSPRFATKEDWLKRAAEVREQILVAEGLWPMPAKTPLNPVIHGRIERDGYTIEKVFFASMPGHYVSGSLYRPTGKSGKLPAVLSPHGHWQDGRFYDAGEAAAKKQIELGAEQTIEGGRYPLQARCAMLARMGCVVFHYDMIGYADSQAIQHREGFTDVEAVLRLQSFMGLQTWNSLRGLDFLAGLPDVDPQRIAVTGASGGGTQTMILCAIDDRPAVAFPAVMVSTAMQGGCICENAPLLRIHTNNVEFASLFAPKPEGMTGANDWTRDIETKGLPELKAIYRLFGAEQQVMAWHRPFEHNYNQVSRELMYNWMNKHLKLGLETPVTEKPFKPVLPKELSVYDADHPRPADSADAAALRKQMTARSDEQLAELRKDPAEYRRVVGAALRAMVNDSLPPADDIVVGNARAPKFANGLVIEKGTIQRQAGVSRTPYVAITPGDWNGSVLVWVHPDGKASLFGADGKPAPAVQRVLDSKSAVIAPDLFLSGELLQASAAPGGKSVYEGQSYPGFFFGYNPSPIANRASDVLSAIALARSWNGGKPVNLIAYGKAGSAALLARALAGDAIQNASIDLDHFDFDQVKDAGDEHMFPGSLKYGGVQGIVALLNSGKTMLWNLRDGEKLSGPVKDEFVEVRDGEMTLP